MAKVQDASDEVSKLLDGMDHAMMTEIKKLRTVILGIDPMIEEGVKWNSLSFRTSEWFATWNWRAKDRIEFVFHLGAKVRDDADVKSIPDPSGLLEWK